MRIRLRFALACGVLFSLLCFGITHPQLAACSQAQHVGPSRAALLAGRAARLLHRGHVHNRKVWTLIDYSLPFTAVRLWVLDGRDDDRVLMASEVSHAWKSGLLYATEFSNVNGSNLSSAGSYVTAQKTYEGSFGHSLRVHGLSRGENDNAFARAIVFHPSVATHSLGCFMLPDSQSRAIIDAIAGGTFVHVHRATP